MRRKIENFPDKTIFHLLVNKFTFRGIKEVSANVYLDTDSFWLYKSFVSYHQFCTEWFAKCLWINKGRAWYSKLQYFGLINCFQWRYQKFGSRHQNTHIKAVTFTKRKLRNFVVNLKLLHFYYFSFSNNKVRFLEFHYVFSMIRSSSHQYPSNFKLSFVKIELNWVFVKIPELFQTVKTSFHIAPEYSENFLISKYLQKSVKGTRGQYNNFC